jgi:hypothetical protein
MISPRPWVQSQAEPALLMVKLVIEPPVFVARMWFTIIGCIRPWRTSSVRWYMRRTGLPNSFEASTASYEASENR